MSYVYDQLSRLSSETRTITGLGSYPLSYGYNFADAMTSVTDPFGAQINYNFDSAGRVKSVTGSGFAGVSNYTSTTSNIQYRAWGAQKSVTYGDGKSATTTYDARLRPLTYDMPGLREQFQYYDDGRLKQMTDLDDRNQDIGYPDTARHFSRARSYDQVGRLTSDKGATSSTFPLNQNYAHDAFNNLTSRYGTYYYQNQTSDTAIYTNNRRQNWTYFADGQVKHSPLAYDVNFNESVYRDWSYDAAGRLVQVQETIANPSSVSTYTTGYDGDGQPVRESTTTATNTITGYMIRSSVLAGQVLTRLDTAGAKQKTVFNVDGPLKAVQLSIGGSNSVSWTHIDPLGLSEAGDTKPVYDALGNYIPWQHVPSGAPPNAYPPFSPNFGGLGSSYGSAQDKDCVLSGLPISCSDLAHQIDIGNVGTDYIIMDSGRLKHEQGEILPLGLGMFAVNYPEPHSEGWQWHMGDTISAFPQKPPRIFDRDEVSVLVNEIRKLFSARPGCEEWTNKLLGELANATGFNAGNIEDILTAFNNTGVIVSNGSVVGTGGGSTGTALGYPAIDLTFGTTPQYTAASLLHEIIHWAGLQGGKSLYDDAAQAAAWHKLGVVISAEQYRTNYPDVVARNKQRDGSDYAESRLAGAAQDIACLDSKPAVRILK